VTGDNAAKSTFVPDTRGDNQPPSWYWSNFPKQVVTEFKYAATIGITGIGTYAPLTTNVLWSDSSGGAIRQTVPDGDNGIFSRQSVSDTSWGAWKKADETGSNTAASITGQGSLATLNSVDWNSTLDSIPDRVSDTATTGLNLTDTYIGYYDGTDFKTYIQSNGNFHFGGVADNFVDFNGTQLVIDTDNFSVDGAGNATFSGDVSASDITGSTITASTITGSTLQTATTGERVVISSATNSLQAYDDDGQLLVSSGTAITAPGQNGRAAIIGRSVSPGYTAGVYGEGTDGSGVIGKSNGSNAGVFGDNTVTGFDAGVGVLGKSLGDYGCWGLSEEDAGVNGASYGGTGVGVRGQGTVYDFYAAGLGANYGPFTGAHDGLLPKNLSPEPGDILCSTGVFEKSSLSQTIPYLETATTGNSKAAYGIFVSKAEIGLKVPAALTNQGPSVKLAYIKENYDRSIANALGEGQINVCSENGDFDIGDFICTSNTAGKGMRYDGQDMRYVVAKCMEPVVWTDEPANIKMVACVYMCG
jgi:hypothetical protein